MKENDSEAWRYLPEVFVWGVERLGPQANFSKRLIFGFAFFYYFLFLISYFLFFKCIWFWIKKIPILWSGYSPNYPFIFLQISGNCLICSQIWAYTIIVSTSQVKIISAYSIFFFQKNFFFGHIAILFPLPKWNTSAMSIPFFFFFFFFFF